MSGKYKKTFQYLNYIENLLIRPSTVTGCLSISAFALCSCRNYEFCSRNKHYAKTAGIKKHTSIKKKKKNHNKIVLLGKDKLNTIEVLFSKALIDSYINHDEFVSLKNLLREYNEVKKETKSPETSVEYLMQKWLI